MYRGPIAYRISSTHPAVDRLGSLAENPAWPVDDGRKHRPKRSTTFDRDAAFVGRV